MANKAAGSSSSTSLVSEKENNFLCTFQPFPSISIWRLCEQNHVYRGKDLKMKMSWWWRDKVRSRVGLRLEHLVITWVRYPPISLTSQLLILPAIGLFSSSCSPNSTSKLEFHISNSQSHRFQFWILWCLIDKMFRLCFVCGIQWNSNEIAFSISVIEWPIYVIQRNCYSMIKNLIIFGFGGGGSKQNLKFLVFFNPWNNSLLLQVPPS